MSIRIILAEDHEIVRQGFRSLLEKQADIEVVGEASNGRDAVRMARELSPDVAIIDISMPDLNGIEATNQIIKEVPLTKVIILSMHNDEMFVENALRAGASGYLIKESAFEELVSAIRAVIINDMYLSSQITDKVVKDYARQLTESTPVLTAREREILQLIAEGKSTKEIASILCVSVNTIATHRNNIMDKLNMCSTAELVKYAIRRGITSV